MTDKDPWEQVVSTVTDPWEAVAPKKSGKKRDPAIIAKRRARLEAVLAAQNPEVIRDPTSPEPLTREPPIFQKQLPDFPEVKAAMDAKQFPDFLGKRDAALQSIGEAGPALGATAAMSMIPGGAPVQAGAKLIPTLGQAVKGVLAKPGGVVRGAGVAAAGGVAGEATLGQLKKHEKPGIDRYIDAAVEQGIADPVARMTMGLGNFLLRPAGKHLGEMTERLLNFARRERLPMLPGTAVDRVVPRLVSDWAKKFYGSRKFSKEQLDSITHHISADANSTGAFFKKVIGDVDPEKLTQNFVRSREIIGNLASKSTNTTLRAAAKKDAPEAAWELFQDAKALRIAKQKLSKKDFDLLTETHAQNLIQRSATSSEKGLVINGDKLMKDIKNTRQTLTKHYGEEVVARLENLAAYASAHKNAPIEAAENLFFNPSAMGTNVATLGPAAVIDPLTLGTGMLAVGRILAGQIFDANSVISKWLTTGLIPKSRAMHLAGKLAFEAPTRKFFGDLAADVRGFQPSQSFPDVIQ